MNHDKKKRAERKERKEGVRAVSGRQFDKSVACTVGPMVRALPVFRGWTVDEGLREFRRMSPSKGMVFIPFDSADGQEFLAEYLKSLA